MENPISPKEESHNEIPLNEVEEAATKAARRLARIAEGSPRHKKNGYRPPNKSWRDSGRRKYPKY